MREEKIKERNKELCKRYPFLIPKDWEGKVPKDFDYSYTEWDALEDGWREAFGDMLLEELRESLVKTGDLKNFGIDQLKEKFGSMRFYYHGGNDEVDKIIDKYSVLSENICIHCGKPDVYMTDKGWMYPCCKECWEKSKYNTNIPYEQFIEGDNQMANTMNWRSYSPEYEEYEDHEVDISETANKIRENWRKKHETV